MIRCWCPSWIIRLWYISLIDIVTSFNTVIHGRRSVIFSFTDFSDIKCIVAFLTGSHWFIVCKLRKAPDNSWALPADCSATLAAVMLLDNIHFLDEIKSTCKFSLADAALFDLWVHPDWSLRHLHSTKPHHISLVFCLLLLIFCYLASMLARMLSAEVTLIDANL